MKSKATLYLKNPLEVKIVVSQMWENKDGEEELTYFGRTVNLSSELSIGSSSVLFVNSKGEEVNNGTAKGSGIDVKIWYDSLQKNEDYDFGAIVGLSKVQLPD